MTISITVKDYIVTRAREKMQNPEIFPGAVLISGGIVAAEFRSETRPGARPYLTLFYSDGKCIHRCAASGACWHLGVGTIAAREFFGRDIIEWERYETFPTGIPTGGRDITPVLASRLGKFTKLTPDSAELCISPEPGDWPAPEPAPEPTPEPEPALAPEDRWLQKLNIPAGLLSRVLEFRAAQKDRLKFSPEAWGRIPNLGGDIPDEAPFAAWMDDKDLLQARSVNYLPQGRELMDALVPLLCDNWSPSLLVGPKSTGKTTLAYFLARVLCLPVTTISGSTDTNEERLLGYHDLVSTPDGVKTRFVPGALLEAVERGEMLVFNELNQALPDVVSVMNDLLDWQKVIHVKGRGTVKPGEGFRLVATLNPGYIGTSPLNQALEDRFRRVDVPYPPPRVVAELLPVEHAEALSRLYSLVVQRVESGEIDEEIISIRALIRCAEEIEILGPEHKKEIIVSNLCSGLQDHNARRILTDIVESIFGEGGDK